MNIIVLCGGISTEREISIKSGTMVCEGLRSAGHNAVLLDVFFGSESKDLFLDSKQNYDVKKEADKIRSHNEEVETLKKTRKTFFGENVIELCQSADIVFMALHGKYGEDGLCQAAFDLNGIKYTGCGYLASAIGMDKGMTKQIFLSSSVPTAKSVWINKGDESSLKSLGMELPVVVKACNGGSSVGVVIVKNEDEYESALKECFSYDDKVLIEQYIDGREFSVGVVEKKALPVVEIIPKCGWYDYENKYVPGATEEVCPAEITEEQTEKMKKIAEDAYVALGCEVYARADIMMDKSGEMYCLEVNTLPGMTPTSLIPTEAKTLGIEFPKLCDMLVQISLKKYEM